MNGVLITVRAIHYAATIAVAGTIFFLVCVAEPAFRAANSNQPLRSIIRFRLAAINTVALAIAVVSGAAWLVLVAEQISDQPLSSVFSEGVVWTVILDTGFGHDWICRLLIACLLAVVLLRTSGRQFLGTRHASAVALLLAAGLVGSVAWAGHASARSGIEGGVNLTADVLHLIAAAAWVGALVPLAVLLRAVGGEDDATSIAVARIATRRFSILGIVSVGTLLATGIVNGWVLVDGVLALINSNYGRLLLLKIALFLVMLSIATVNRLQLTPSLMQAQDTNAIQNALRRLQRNSIIEAGIGAIVILIVGLLGILQPDLLN